MKRLVTKRLLLAAILCPCSVAFVPLIHRQCQLLEKSTTKVNVGGYFDLREQEKWNENGKDEANLNAADSPALVSQVGKLESAITKFTMMTFIASMCVVLPLALIPTTILYHSKVISKSQKEEKFLETGQFVSKWLLRMLPFAKVSVESQPEENPVPSIWVCNHTSMLDVFFLLAYDEKLRGKNKRPIKSVYWKGLDANPICKILFQGSGFIPVDMEDNGNGNPNQYDKHSFKRLVKESKKAFEDGFDLLVLPEGQLNPWPEKGLLEVFPGAVKLAQISRRPIRLVAMHGLHRLWHPDDTVGMTVTGRQVKMRAYPGPGRMYKDGEEFVATMNKVIGHYGAVGEDLPDFEKWLNGTAYKEECM